MQHKSWWGAGDLTKAYSSQYGSSYLQEKPLRQIMYLVEWPYTFTSRFAHANCNTYLNWSLIHGHPVIRSKSLRDLRYHLYFGLCSSIKTSVYWFRENQWLAQYLHFMRIRDKLSDYCVVEVNQYQGAKMRCFTHVIYLTKKVHMRKWDRYVEKVPPTLRTSSMLHAQLWPILMQGLAL